MLGFCTNSYPLCSKLGNKLGNLGVTRDEGVNRRRLGGVAIDGEKRRVVGQALSLGQFLETTSLGHPPGGQVVDGLAPRSHFGELRTALGGLGEEGAQLGGQRIEDCAASEPSRVTAPCFPGPLGLLPLGEKPYGKPHAYGVGQGLVEGDPARREVSLMDEFVKYDGDERDVVVLEQVRGERVVEPAESRVGRGTHDARVQIFVAEPGSEALGVLAFEVTSIWNAAHDRVPPGVRFEPIHVGGGHDVERLCLSGIGYLPITPTDGEPGAFGESASGGREFEAVPAQRIVGLDEQLLDRACAGEVAGLFDRETAQIARAAAAERRSDGQEHRERR